MQKHVPFTDYLKYSCKPQSSTLHMCETSWKAVHLECQSFSPALLPDLWHACVAYRLQRPLIEQLQLPYHQDVVMSSVCSAILGSCPPPSPFCSSALLIRAVWRLGCLAHRVLQEHI